MLQTNVIIKFRIASEDIEISFTVFEEINMILGRRNNINL